MLRIAYVTIDCENPRQLAGFWGQLLNADVTTEGDEAWLTAATDHGNGYVNLLFVKKDTPHLSKNRVAIELAPDDYQAQVERATKLGAQLVPGDESEPWTTFTDPEGNEFSILEFH